MDSAHLPADKKARSIRNAHRYLAALKPNLPDEARRPWEIVSRLLAEIEAKKENPQ
jgi:hypothetical protein